jgi:hypothetical protein
MAASLYFVAPHVDTPVNVLMNKPVNQTLCAEVLIRAPAKKIQLLKLKNPNSGNKRAQYAVIQYPRCKRNGRGLKNFVCPT